MTKRLMPASLRYVEEIARRGSIQRTARELNVAASAIDRHLLGLEAELGVALFERLPRGMRATPAGEAVAAMARDWRADLRRVASEVRGLRGESRGHVRIVAMDSHANGLLPALITALAHAHPAITVAVETASNTAATEALLGDRADVAIVHNLAPHREIRTVATEVLPFGCVMAPAHPLAGLGSATLQQIARHPLALQDRSLAIRRYLDANHSWLLDLPFPRVETSSLQLVKALARTGHYVAFTSELDATDELLGGSLRFVPVRDEGAAAQSVSVALMARNMARAAQAVGDLAVDMVRTQLGQVRAIRG